MDVTAWLRLTAIAMVPVSAWTAFAFGGRLKRGWKRLLVRAGTSTVGVVGLVVVPVFLLFEATCTRHPRSIASPDGRYVAITTHFVTGAVGGYESAMVHVRSAWSLHSELVFDGLGGWNFKDRRPYDPEVRWLEDKRLLIRYRDDPQGLLLGWPTVCVDRVGDVEVVCQH